MASAVARGVQFNYSILGQGAPHLVGIHGLVLDNISSFYFSIGPALATQSSLLLFDLRGHGRSEQPPDGYDIASLAMDTKALLDTVEFSSEGVILLGHSFGGLVSLQYAALFPDDVKGLILLEAHTGTPEFGRRMAETLGAPAERQAQMAEELFGDWVSLQERLGRQEDVATTENKMRRMRSRKRTATVDIAEQLLRNTTLIQDMAETPPLGPEVLSGIECPVLAVYGAESDILHEGQRLAQLIPNCRLEVIPNCGHGVMWQQKPAVMDIITEWLRQFRP